MSERLLTIIYFQYPLLWIYFLHLILNNNSWHYHRCNEDTCVERTDLLDMVALEQYSKYVFLHLFFIAVNVSSHAKCESISSRKSLSCAWVFLLRCCTRTLARELGITVLTEKKKVSTCLYNRALLYFSSLFFFYFTIL